MRIASKNEMLTIMGDKALNFAAFCVSPDGAIINFLFQNGTNFDLDLPIMQQMIANMETYGIFDEECVQRFADFNSTTVEPILPTSYMYRVNNDYPIPEGVITMADPQISTCYIIISTNPIPGLEVI